MTTKRTMEEHMSHVHKWAHKPELDVSVCACGAKAAGVPYTPLTKRTMGQCSEECIRHRYASAMNGACGHLASCPALYPLQRQPGDEKDALAKLAAHVRTAWDLGRSSTMRLSAEEWESAALDLISETREDLKRACTEEDRLRTDAVSLRRELTKAKADISCLRVEKDGANERARMLLDAKNDIADDLRQKVAALEHDLAKTMDALLDTQKGMGEVRQQAMQEGREQGHLDAVLWLREFGHRQPTSDDLEYAMQGLSLK